MGNLVLGKYLLVFDNTIGAIDWDFDNSLNVTWANGDKEKAIVADTLAPDKSSFLYAAFCGGIGCFRG